MVQRLVYHNKGRPWEKHSVEMERERAAAFPTDSFTTAFTRCAADRRHHGDEWSTRSCDKTESSFC